MRTCGPGALVTGLSFFVSMTPSVIARGSGAECGGAVIQFEGVRIGGGVLFGRVTGPVVLTVSMGGAFVTDSSGEEG